MRKIVTAVILIPLAVIIVTFAVANRQIITVSFDPRRLSEPKKPSSRSFEGKSDSQLTDEERANKELEQKHEEWQKQIDDAREKVSQLNERFAGWYYVISSDAFDKIHLTRKDLVKAKGK